MSFVLDQFTAPAAFFGKHAALIYKSSLWHKIQVDNVQGLDRDVVLKALMDTVHPLDFIPVKYETMGQASATFLLKNCGAAIQHLCGLNLVVKNPVNQEENFMLTINLNFANAYDLKINVQKNITSVLSRRFNSETAALNLEQFYKDPDLLEFCSLSQPKLLFYVLHLSRYYGIKVLNLANNGIEALKPLEAIYNVKTLTHLDLRNNNIKSMEELENLKDLRIRELWLDGNPICDEYDEVSYSKALTGVLKSLEKLDGVHVATRGGFLSFRRNFLCKSSALDLVDQFLEHYFNLYDSPNRGLLENMYHRNAIFAITSAYLPNQTTSISSPIYNYKRMSRNIKQISDYSKNEEFLWTGPQDISKAFSSLPPTEHDPYTFTVDLMTYTETTAIIVITGVFREALTTFAEFTQSREKLYGFTRTFVLFGGGRNGIYRILNEQYHISNATTAQASKAFKCQKVPKPSLIQIPAPQNVREQSEIIQTLKIITGLTTECAKNFLEDSHYDLKKALTVFVDLFKLDRIPQTAFMREFEVPKTQQQLQADLQKIQDSFAEQQHSPDVEYVGTENISRPQEMWPVDRPVETPAPRTVAANRGRNVEIGDDIFDLVYINEGAKASESAKPVSANKVDKVTTPTTVEESQKSLTRSAESTPECQGATSEGITQLPPFKERLFEKRTSFYFRKNGKRRQARIRLPGGTCLRLYKDDAVRLGYVERPNEEDESDLKRE